MTEPARAKPLGAALLAALLATAALLSGCSTGPGPLGDAGGGSCEGFPGLPGQLEAFGEYFLVNKSSSTVTIQSVTLGTSHGLRMTGGAWLMPIIGGNMLGGGAWPPDIDNQAPMAPAWAARRRADGAVIKPGQTRELMLGVARATTKPGWSGGPLIVYTAGGSTYTVQKNPAIYLGPTGPGCLPGKPSS